MKRILPASVAVVALAGTAFAEAPQYLGEQAAIASGTNYHVNSDQALRASHNVDRFTTSAVPGHSNTLGNYGPTVAPDALHR